MDSDSEEQSEGGPYEGTLSHQSTNSLSDSGCDKVYYIPAFDGETHSYDTITEMKNAINARARQHGYAVKITHTRYDKTQEKKARRVVFNCDRHRSYVPSKRKSGVKRRSRTSTKKTNCTMAVDGILDRATGRWYIKPLETIECDGVLVCAHNHPASETASSHAAHRHQDMNEDVVNAIIADAEVGIRPSQSLARLQHLYPKISLRPQDIVNIRNKILAERMGNMTRTEYLVSLLTTNDVVVHRRLDSEDRLSHLFFASENVLAIFGESPDVILMDCTYKTNKFGMPLLNMIGTSGMNTTAHLAQAFLRSESTEDYIWALTSLKATLDAKSIRLLNVIFIDRDLALLGALAAVLPDVPVLLCPWHVIKAVETHARRTSCRVIDEVATREKGRDVFKDSPSHRAFCDKFLELVRAATQEEYERRREELHALSPKEAAYIDTTWLNKWKTKIVRCWTNEVRHFGLQTTSRVEGYHRSMKRSLDTSAGDLLALYSRVKAWWTWSINIHKQTVSDIQVKARVDLLAMPVFRRVHKLIYNHALDKCVSQLDLVTNTTCTGIYTRTTGLPCVHKLRLLTQQKKPLIIADFDVHWWVHRSQGTYAAATAQQAPSRIMDPAVSARRQAEVERGRRHSTPHVRGVGVNGTRRAPSGFELSEGINIPSLSSIVDVQPKRLRVLAPIRYNP